MMDMWTDTFAVPGRRTSGTGVQYHAMVPPRWQGQLPQGVGKIQAPTPYVWIGGRTRTNGLADYEAVHEIQNGHTLTPISQWRREPRPIPFASDPTVDMDTEPLRQVNSRPAAKFFSYAAELMKLHAQHLTGWSILTPMRRIGIEVGQSFDYE